MTVTPSTTRGVWARTELFQRLCVRGRVEVECVAQDRHVGAEHAVASGDAGAFSVDEVPYRKSESGAVGEHLVGIGVRVAAGLLRLVLRVDDSPGCSVRVLPHDVGFEFDSSFFVKVVPGLSEHAAASRGQRLSQRDGEELLEHERHVEHEPVDDQSTLLLVERAAAEHELTEPQSRLVACVESGRLPGGYERAARERLHVGHGSEETQQALAGPLRHARHAEEALACGAEDAVLEDVNGVVVVSDFKRHGQPETATELLVGANASATSRPSP